MNGNKTDQNINRSAATPSVQAESFIHLLLHINTSISPIKVNILSRLSDNVPASVADSSLVSQQLQICRGRGEGRVGVLFGAKLTRAFQTAETIKTRPKEGWELYFHEPRNVFRSWLCAAIHMSQWRGALMNMDSKVFETPKWDRSALLPRKFVCGKVGLPKPRGSNAEIMRPWQIKLYHH